jgi:hypothetical protein
MEASQSLVACGTEEESGSGINWAFNMEAASRRCVYKIFSLCADVRSCSDGMQAKECVVLLENEQFWQARVQTCANLF